jgi:hypothetical protein
MEPESVLKILIVYLNLSLPPKNSGMGLGCIIKTSSKIIKEQLPLKQNTWKRTQFTVSLPITNS